MSGERFDRDLAAVLREDAPMDVPEGLRVRVGSVTSLDPGARAPRRAAWTRPVLWAGALAAVLAVAVGVWRFGPSGTSGIGTDASPSSSPSPSAEASAETSAVIATPEPSSTAVAGPVACQVGDLKGSILGWQGAAGSRIADVEVRNTGSAACELRATGLQLIDGTGHVLIDSAAASSKPSLGKAVLVAAGARVTTEVRVANYCGSDGTLPIAIGIEVAPGGARLLVKPAAGVSSSEAVPPCMGSVGPTIDMNGWVAG